MSIEKRLQELGIVLPKASNPAGNYTNTVQVHNLLFVSGKGPTGTDGNKPKGKLGKEYTTEQGYEYAKQAGLELVAVLKLELGSLDRVRRIVKIQGFVNATPEFEEHHKVLNGCSDLMAAIFGEKGVHARSVQGVASLRDNLPIVIDSIIEIHP